MAGGRDGLHGGTWLALTPSGRFGAVTNLRGTVRAAEARSRGELVTRFVQGDVSPLEYGREVAQRIGEYGGFHLLAGEIGGDLVQISGDIVSLQPGIHGLSNAPAGVTWPKVTTAVEAMHGALEANGEEIIAEHLLRVLRMTPGHGDPTRDLFIRGDRYGTRSSSVIVAGPDTVLLVEDAFSRDGVPVGERVALRFSRRP